MKFKDNEWYFFGIFVFLPFSRGISRWCFFLKHFLCSARNLGFHRSKMDGRAYCSNGLVRNHQLDFY